MRVMFILKQLHYYVLKERIWKSPDLDIFANAFILTIALVKETVYNNSYRMRGCVKMKLDFRAELTMSQKRTTKIIVETMFLLLTKKSFEEITVREICRIGLIPNSTFYNYFEDKYDVLRWAFFKEVYRYYPEVDIVMNHYDNIDKCADAVCDFIEEYKGVLTRVAKKNPINGAFYQIISQCCYDFGLMIAKNCTRDKNFDYPYEVVFSNYVNGVLGVLSQTFYNGNTYSRKQIHTYFTDLYAK